MNDNHYCVIMAGGVGARFWPMSRTSYPKQFIDILGTGQTLIQKTFERFEKICPRENIYIVTHENYGDLVRRQIPGLNEGQILFEPMRRNTAPCIAYANYKILSRNPDAVVVVAPSDHIIIKEDVFIEVITTALEASENNDWLLTLGIKPSRPDTGYGYIQFMDSYPYAEDARIRKVKTFTEKPEYEMARSFIKSGDFLWNSGIFIWSLKAIMKAFRDHLTDIDAVFKEGQDYYNTPGEKDFISKTYAVCKSISIDYGVMEKADNVYVLASDFGWSDLGTWVSLFEHLLKDANGNSIKGRNVMAYDLTNTIVKMPDDRLVVLQGLDDYIVVEQDGILLVCRKSEEQKIRQFVNDVRTEKGDKYV